MEWSTDGEADTPDHTGCWITSLLAVAFYGAAETVPGAVLAQERAAASARWLATEISGMDASGTGPALLLETEAQRHGANAWLVTDQGAVLAGPNDGPAPESSWPWVAMAEAEAGEGRIVRVSMPLFGAVDGLWQRLLAALALAAAATGSTLFRQQQSLAANGRQRQQFEDLIATIPFGVACWSPAGTMVACNEQYRARLNIDAHEARPGRSYHAAIREQLQGGYVRVVKVEGSNRLLELHREDGSCLLIDERPLCHGGFVSLVTDITENKRTDLLLRSIQQEQRVLARRYHEEKLRAEAASRSKTNFLAHLSHDIRTPLNHIIGFADLIRHQAYGPLGNSRYLGYVDNIKSSGERMLASFATILDLAELESGQKPLRQEPVDVDALVSQTVERYRAQIDRAGLTLVLGEPVRTTLVGDRFCLQRMLGNIIDNAIRFTPSGGRVTVAAFAAADGIVLEVSDTGIGMSEERLSSLSQPFVYGDAAFTRQNGSAGLGIAIARTIAELTGGRLAVDSSPSLGTTVAISLPLPVADAEQPGQAAE